MSNSASLAAAKKRRSQPANIPLSNEKQQQQQKQPQPQNTQPPINVTPAQLLKTHNYKLYLLEKNFESLKDDLVTKNDLELLHFNKLGASPHLQLDNKIINTIENTNTDILALKREIKQLTTNITEVTSLAQTMRATILSQTNEIEQLKELKTDFYKFLETRETKDLEETQDTNETPTKDTKGL